MTVMRLGYAHLRVSDMEAARRHYATTLGLRIAAETNNMIYFKGWDEFDHHSIVLEQGGSGLVKLGYKCQTADDLAVYEHRARAFGVAVERMSKGDNLATGDGLRVTLPSEQVVELYSDMEYVGTETGTLNPEVRPRHPRGVDVPRLDHAAITAPNPEEVERFFCEVLGFRASERLISDPAQAKLVASFLYCGQSMHDIAVLPGPPAKLSHVAFWVEDWSAILHAGDIFAMDDTPVEVGPSRHGAGRALTSYFFDPAGNRNEIQTGSYRTYPDTPTVSWTADHLNKSIFYIQREVRESFLTQVT
jgi:catechol 2,3-dioxygenase